MCGICGIVRSGGGEVDPSRLGRMTEAMVHRGPDDAGFHTAEGVGLGFRRLSIIDIEGSRQPLSNEDRSVWLVFNGEIYNYQALRSTLEQRGHTFTTAGDGEVIVHAYEEWGADCPEHLRGMFAFAVWDERRRCALLVRDRLGIKPLYYSCRNGLLTFASELGAVMASGLVSNDLNASAIDAYLSLMYIPANLSVYSAVSKLPPASRLILKDGQARVETYWRPPEETTGGPAGVDEAADRLMELLKDSVRLHLQSDVPLGVFLSGGVDSSAMVALASLAGGRPKTFSVGFETRSHDELDYARTVARHYDTDHHELTVRADAAALLPRIVAAFGEPFGDSSAVPTYYLSRFAAESVKVVIGGDGGDELFAGYEWTRRQRFVEYWRRMPAWARGAFRGALAGCRASPGLPGRLSRFARDAEGPAFDGYLRRVSCLTPEIKRELYAGDLRALLDHPVAPALVGPWFADAGGSSIASMNRADLALYLPDDDLCKVDRMTMLNSLEGRVPMLDHCVAEFALSLPMSYKLHGLTSKYVLKKALTPHLPPSILRQRKQGFSVPISKWMRQDLHVDARRLLLDGEMLARGMVNRACLAGMLEAHRVGRREHGHQLWVVLMLELWLRICAGSDPLSSHDDMKLSDL